MARLTTVSVSGVPCNVLRGNLLVRSCQACRSDRRCTRRRSTRNTHLSKHARTRMHRVQSSLQAPIPYILSISRDSCVDQRTLPFSGLSNTSLTTNRSGRRRSAMWPTTDPLRFHQSLKWFTIQRHCPQSRRIIRRCMHRPQQAHTRHRTSRKTQRNTTANHRTLNPMLHQLQYPVAHLLLPNCTIRARLRLRARHRRINKHCRRRRRRLQPPFPKSSLHRWLTLGNT